MPTSPEEQQILISQLVLQDPMEKDVYYDIHRKGFKHDIISKARVAISATKKWGFAIPPQGFHYDEDPHLSNVVFALGEIYNDMTWIMGFDSAEKAFASQLETISALLSIEKPQGRWLSDLFEDAIRVIRFETMIGPSPRYFPDQEKNMWHLVDALSQLVNVDDAKKIMELVWHRETGHVTLSDGRVVTIDDRYAGDSFNLEADEFYLLDAERLEYFVFNMLLENQGFTAKAKNEPMHCAIR